MEICSNKDVLPVIEGFPRPNWQAIGARIEALPESSWSDQYEKWARRWLDATLAHLPTEYRVVETENFAVLSGQNDRYLELLTTFLERARKAILSSLDGITSDVGYGKHVVLIFDDQDKFYEYKAYFYPEEGEFILSSGTFLNTEYGHFTFPFMDMYEAEATAAHELTHACLSHLSIPLWLDEGFAVSMEDDICGSVPLQMDRERRAEHGQFWNSDTIQEFWSGKSFNRTDNGSTLSYELARFCIKSLAHDYGPFATFANNASWKDGGEAAATNQFGGSLGGLIHQFFGDGDWSPKPKTWGWEDDAE